MITFESPDIETFKNNLETCIEAVKKHKLDSHSAIKIQSLLNVTIYVMATRFLEASIKHIVYNCCIMRGDPKAELEATIIDLKGFNNPMFSKIKGLFQDKLSFDISSGLANGKYVQSDIAMLEQIVTNRHRNVHATNDSNDWYNCNTKDIEDFNKEYVGLLHIIKYLDTLTYNKDTSSFQCK